MRRGVLVRRSVLTLCSLFLLGIVLGCMSLSIGERHEVVASEDGISSQSGEVKVPGGQELDVYYPVPFASPPNLTVTSTWDDAVMVDQQADHFRVKNPGAFSERMRWEARGLKARPPAVVVPVPATSPATPSSPPTAPPMPIESAPPR